MPLYETGANNESQRLVRLGVLVRDWLNSAEREEMLVGKRYFEGFHDILNRQRMVIGEGGALVPVDNIPNNKLIDNQYKKIVEQKTNYALGKPLTIATADDTYLEELNSIFDKKLFRQLRILGEEAINSGIAWLYPYYDDAGNFKVKVFPGYEIMPIWSDRTHTDLDSAVRAYSDTLVTSGGNLRDVTVIEEYTVDGVDRYIMEGANIRPVPEFPHRNYITLGEREGNWGRIPLIPFKYNSKEIPIIRNLKTLQDALNQVMSDFQNNMEEDPRTTILILKNYDGTNIPEFRRNLATYGVVKVQTVDGVQGDVDTLKIEVSAQNYQAILMQLKRAIVENGRGFDAKEERMDGDPNQMNIESMYTDIDLDVNQMESEFQAGFEELKYYIDNYLIMAGKGDFTEEQVEFVFNRDIFINEDAKIDNCVKSVGVISTKTLLAHHPWVTDLQHELDQLEEDKQVEMDEMEQMAAFENRQQNQNNSSGGGNNA